MKIISTVILATTVICGAVFSQQSPESTSAPVHSNQVSAKNLAEARFHVQGNVLRHGEKQITIITDIDTGQQMTLATDEKLGLDAVIKIAEVNTENGSITLEVDDKTIVSELVNVGVYTPTPIVDDSFKSLKGSEYIDPSSDANQAIVATMLAKAIALQELDSKRLKVKAEESTRLTWIYPEQTEKNQLIPRPDNR